MQILQLKQEKPHIHKVLVCAVQNASVLGTTSVSPNGGSGAVGRKAERKIIAIGQHSALQQFATVNSFIFSLSCVVPSAHFNKTHFLNYLAFPISHEAIMEVQLFLQSIN